MLNSSRSLCCDCCFSSSNYHCRYTVSNNRICQCMGAYCSFTCIFCQHDDILITCCPTHFCIIRQSQHRCTAGILQSSIYCNRWNCFICYLNIFMCFSYICIRKCSTKIRNNISYFTCYCSI